uniref:Latent-transforming growth factor beta-binding protein 1 n=1 Tax=Esox lucius TaxID=8010 RepID=A0A3P8Y7W9_ESOLU
MSSGSIQTPSLSPHFVVLLTLFIIDNMYSLYAISLQTTLHNDRAVSAGLFSFPVLCPMLCQNGGVCIQKDRCLCPPTFTGKFCHIPVATPSTNDIEKPPPSPSVLATQQLLTQSEYLLPLHSQQQSHGVSGSSMVKVRVRHPPEASVKIHQVLKVGYGPGTDREQPETVTRSAGLSGARAGLLPGERAEAPPPKASVQAQTLRGDSIHTEASGFKYCFREVRNGQCSSPLPGLRSQDTCCRGIGLAWGINQCVLCPANTGRRATHSGVNGSCPAGFNRINGTQCVDVNECLQPGFCENGNCVNTRGSYSCVCRQGYILDASHGICVSHKVISEDKGQCYRILTSGSGPGSCSVPILRNITKQICCCSRVGKAWGKTCERCPYFGSVAFKEICPAGPGYHYSSSAIKFNQRVLEQLGTGGPPVISQSTPQTQAQGAGNARLTTQPRPQQPSRGASLPHEGGAHTPASMKPAEIASLSPFSIHDCAPLCFCCGIPFRRPVRGVCDARPQVCGQGSCVDLPAGRHTCVCNQGYQLNALQTQCQDIDECRTSRPPCGSGRCHNTDGGYRCTCPSGYQPGAQSTSCIDVDECRQVPNPCFNSRCENSPGSFRCVCRTGYKLEGNTCTGKTERRSTENAWSLHVSDVDECCGQIPGPCTDGHCENSQGSYSCTCPAGYRLQGDVCADVDECTPFPCTNGRCENTPGSYQCVCRSGFKLEDSACIDINECEEPSQCPGQQCVNSVGSYKCIACKVGHSLQNGVCSDVDECQVPDTCGTDRLCVNTDGSYRCDCKPGFRTGGHGRQCRDINECLEGDFCFPKGECVNTVGSYQCVCSQGYTTSSNGSSCLDVDECARFGQGLCPDGRCINTEGSYQCKCQVGFTTNPEKTACLGNRTPTFSKPLWNLYVDECVDSKGAVCVSQRCANTIGSYRCFTSCEPGYRVTPNGECVDINECANMTVCGENAFCQNLIGTYQCVCDQGYTATSDGKACVDEDECVTMQDVCGTARCENADGSFTCECPREGEEFDTRSGQCHQLAGTSSPPACVPARPLFPGGPSHSGPQRRPGVPQVSQLPLARPGELRECYYNMAEQRSCSVLARNVTWQECCCTVGQGWGLACQYDPCPRVGTADYQALCPSGHGYVTGPGAFSYRDVDECKLFHPEMCKRGVCVNNIPGYSCYCHIGYYHDTELLECVDFNECDSVEDRCPGGVCVNVLGSYYCKCEPPLVLDDTQRSCVNSTVDDELSFCWEHVTDDLVCQSPLLRLRATYTFCCCLYGEAWGLQCALCPTRGSGRQETCRVSLKYRTAYLYHLIMNRHPAPPHSSPERYYDEDQYGPPDAPQRPPLRTLPDPRSERAFGVRPPPPIPEGLPLSLAPLPDSDPYSDEEEGGPEPWRAGPPFSDRQGPGAGPWGAFERRYEPYASLSTEDCGILHGCENGRCIRVAEGYTCDCFEGYELDMTSMTCIDINECQDPDDVCVNGRCVNTDGSYRCVCHRGYVMSRRPGHCVAA